MATLLGFASLPVVFLLSTTDGASVAQDGSAFAVSLVFAFGGALAATAFGATAGIVVGTLSFAGRRALVAAACALIAAPPAVWWLGATRVPGMPWGVVSGVTSGLVVAGLAFSPIPMLLVLAALRELPCNVYEAARVALPPGRRLVSVLLPLLRAPLTGSFLLTMILLLGESEIPFLFGFRTLATEIVTVFAQSFDVRRTLPLVAPLLGVVLVLGALAGRPIVQTLLSSCRGSHGIVRRRAPAAVAMLAVLPILITALSLTGYTWAALSGRAEGRLEAATVAASILEPVGCAWALVLLVVSAAYVMRTSAAIVWCLYAGLLLFCIPSAIFGIGWIGIGHALGGVSVPPWVAHGSHMLGMPLLAFAAAYSRLPGSLEDAARLVPISPLRRASTIILPMLAPSLAAAAAVVAALTFADRDVSSMLLQPGAARLTLDFYLVSANAPSAVIGRAALVLLAGAGVSVSLAAAGPWLLWRRRG